MSGDKITEIGQGSPNVGSQHSPGYGGEAPGHDGVDLREGEAGQVGLNDERRRGLTEEDVGGGIERLTSSCPCVIQFIGRHLLWITAINRKYLL